MTDHPPRSVAPWLALGGAVVLVVAALLVLEDDDASAAGSGDVVGATPPEEPAVDTPPPVEPVEPPKPEPLSAEGGAGRPGTVAPDDWTTDEQPAVVGWVEDTEQNRLVDVEVNLFDDMGDYLDSTFSDEQGEFSFPWDEPLTSGWSVATEAEAVPDPLAPGVVVPDSYVHGADHVPGDPPVTVRLVLAPAPRLTGHVLDARTRRPIDFADIEAVSMLPAWRDEFQDTFSEEDGSFVLSFVDLAAREIVVRVEDEDDRVAILGPLDLAPGEERYVEVLMSDPLDLSGTVYSIAEGSPVEDAEVTVLPLHESFDSGEGWDITWDDGSWEIDWVEVPPEQLALYVEAEGHGPALVRPERPDLPIDIGLGAPVIVGGVVVDGATGEPIEDAMVRFVLRGPAGPMEDYEDIEYTAGDGTFEIVLETVPPSAAEVFVEADEHVRYRAALSELAPTHRDWRRYDIAIELKPAPDV